MKKTLLSILFAYLLVVVKAQIPAGYYNNATGKIGTQLQLALHDIIKNHTQVSYTTLWTSFKTTDKKTNGTVWDMYSDIPGGSAPYEFTFGTDQCGSTSPSAEGGCYNREHSWPKSWFGGEIAPMYTDLFHLIPTDSYVNSLRNNYPYGDVGTALITTKNGTKIGYCVDAGYTNLVFEPRDEFKGDLARNYFYMATRYLNEDSGWPGSAMATGSQLKPWAVAMLLVWSQNDPVSAKETARNKAVYGIQGNRNPFIDHPEYANAIWGTNVGIEDEPAQVSLQVYPNPVSGNCTITLPPEFNQQYNFAVYSSTGNPVAASLLVTGDKGILDMERLPAGFYLVRLTLNKYHTTYQARIIKK